MKRLFAVAMLLAPMICAAAENVQSPAECLASAAGNTPASCLVMHSQLRFIVCGSSMRGVRLGLQPSAECDSKGAGSLSDHYAATLKSFDGNAAAQSMTKDYYALWMSSMNALMPTGERESAWDARTEKMQFQLNQLGNRLKLERSTR